MSWFHNLQRYFPTVYRRQVRGWSAVAVGSMAQLMMMLSPAIASESCPAALDQLQRHQVTGGETLASIADIYNLQPETLTRFNPDLGSSPSAPLPAGRELIVPPFNGRIVSVSQGESWQSIAERTGSRADLLFEVNGCVSDLPNQIFVPGANLIAASTRAVGTLQLSGYPLSESADIVLSYGWQPHPQDDELVFNSGLAFEVVTPMNVQSVGPGTVAFVGEREGYGRLLVINHEQGLQTRYANLSDISVSVGQSVSESMVVGTVGTELTDSASTTYMYFEVRTNSADGWIAQNPARYLPSLELR